MVLTPLKGIDLVRALIPFVVFPVVGGGGGGGGRGRHLLLL